MRKIVYFIVFFAFNFLQAQDLFQNVKGRIIDKDTKFPLIGAVISLMGDTTIQKSVTESDDEGKFVLNKVPVGRHQFKITYIGYESITLSNIVISSGKEVELNIELEEKITQIKEVVISAVLKEGTLNDMASVSSRTFRVEETERYAGSRQDPARMAANFAGVQGTDDSRNDIVIRGNSPMGVLWRLEDINIPNPSHFSMAGSTGGPLSIINNKYLGTSDFMTGAFPAEYGNATAGVFDVKMRNGNTSKREHSLQLGALGMEGMTEGQIKKGKSSYLASYRYSTLEMLKVLGVSIGTQAVPSYQDAAFRIFMPTKSLGTFSLFGIGGYSKITINVSNLPKPPEELYGQNDRDQVFKTYMGVGGLSHIINLNSKSYIKSVLSVSSQDISAEHHQVYRNATNQVTHLNKILGTTFKTNKVGFSTSVTHKFNARNTLKTGIYIDNFVFDYVDSFVPYNQNETIKRLDFKGSTFLIQPYIQWKFKFSEKTVLNAGLNYQILTLNSASKALEPRIGLKHKLSNKSTLSVGYGLHSQMQSNHIYFYQRKINNEYRQENKNIGFTKSHHFVLTFDRSISQIARIKVESYFQSVFDIPIYTRQSSFSLINQGAGFTRIFPDTTMRNAGTGKNYGIEFTLERFFSKNYFFMFTTSLFDSKYIGSDGISRSTDFNGKFASNILAGYEKSVGKSKKTTLVSGIKLTWAGGKLYSPIDAKASAAMNEIVASDSERNSKRFKNYFRMDVRLGFKRNKKSSTHEFSIDLVNFLNTKNILSLIYAPDLNNPTINPVKEQTQLGFLPLFYYKIDF